MDDEKLCIGSILVAIVMLGVLGGMTYYDEYGLPWDNDDDDGGSDVMVIEEGDTVSLDYIGRFVGGGDSQGPVFDTSIPEVARNGSIKKSPGFIEKPTYDDLSFEVGSNSTIKGFDEAVLGKKVGQTFTVTVPPEKGYGFSNPGLVLEVNSTVTIPMRETLDIEHFQRRYPGTDPKMEGTFLDPFWKWDVQILESTPEEITVLQQPIYGEDYKAFPWNVTVVDLSTSRNIITLHHNLEEIGRSTMVPFGMIELYDTEWTDEVMEKNDGNPPMEGIVSSKGGVITIDFNPEVAGKTLVFQITINDITREE